MTFKLFVILFYFAVLSYLGVQLKHSPLIMRMLRCLPLKSLKHFLSVV